MMDVDNKSNNEVNDKKIKNILIKYLISLSILLVILLITLINLSRITMFGKVIGSFGNVLGSLGVILFFVTLIFSSVFLITILILILIRYLKKKEWKELLILIDKKTDLVNFIFEVFAILLFIMTFIFTPCTVQGDSMNPTFLSGQNVICSNYMAGSPKINDIIVFDARNENFKVDDVFYIKRVVAVPGATVKYNPETCELYINDVMVQKLGDDSNIAYEKYQRINQSIGKTKSELEYDVPKGKYLVMGDNRGNSQDSRSFGYINKKQIFGKVVMRIFPLNKIKVF